MFRPTSTIINPTFSIAAYAFQRVPSGSVTTVRATLNSLRTAPSDRLSPSLAGLTVSSFDPTRHEASRGLVMS